ncbi:MAG: type IV toxin-antitoxin system AbiEi family antitoxin domain-containing protein [Solirubrobacterales bacterium]
MVQRRLQQRSGRGLWALTARQHGVVTRSQLLGLGFSVKAVDHRIARGRLHPVHRGVYAVGRPELTTHGRWMAAVLACGPEAVLSHECAAALWEIRPDRGGKSDVTVPAGVLRRHPGVRLRRTRRLDQAERDRRHGIPVTTPIRTLIDIATRLERNPLEAAINEADKRGLADPEALRAAVEESSLPGAAKLRRLLDRTTFVLTDSELERLFLPIARRVGLPPPQTRRYVNGFKVDFHWPDLGLVVETDGLRYHRTPAQQARDRLRDQAHTAAGLTQLRFTHAQIRFAPRHVEGTLAAVARRKRDA